MIVQNEDDVKGEVVAYRSLEKLYHMDSSPDRDAINRKNAQERLKADSTFRTRIVVREGELFIAFPRELTLLQEKVLRIERKVSELSRKLAPMARWALVRSLIFDEVVQTNALEAVKSSRQEVAEALEGRSAGNLQERRLRETARIYVELSEGGASFPTSPKEIRAIYDRIMDTEPTADSPDGALFRNNGVDVIGSSGRAIHTGIEGEDKIAAYMEQMISLVADGEIPSLLSAVASHYLFEYVHPFYDGNGRTGRYLLSLALATPLSTLTVLSLSRVIAENKDAYYRSFTEAEKPLNHGELTFFVMNMLETVREAQSRLLDEVESYSQKVQNVTERIEAALKYYGFAQTSKKRQERFGQILFGLMLYEILDLPGGATRQELRSNLKVSDPVVREAMNDLVEANLVDVVRQKPFLYRPASELVRYFSEKEEAS